MIYEKALVSVIIPIFRVEKYLKKSVSSITDQTYRNLQIILVDDGSDDKCPEICDELAKNDDRIVALHKVNGGLSDARNYGLKYATGNYIYFFDSDDFLELNAIETMVNAIEEKNADAVAFSYRRINENGKVLEEVHFKGGYYKFESEKEKIRYICRKLCGYKVGWEAWNRIYRADVIKSNNLRYEPNKEIFAEDWCFNTYYSLCTKNMYVIDEVLHNYLMRDDSIMGKLPDPPINKILHFMDYIDDYLVKEGYHYIHKRHQYINIAVFYRMLILMKKDSYRRLRSVWKCTDIDKRFGNSLVRLGLFIKALGFRSGPKCYMYFQRFINA